MDRDTGMTSPSLPPTLPLSFPPTLTGAFLLNSSSSPSKQYQITNVYQYRHYANPGVGSVVFIMTVYH